MHLQVPRRGTCKCVRAGSPIPRQGRRGDNRASGRGSRGLPGGGIRGSPRPRGRSNRGSEGFPGGKPVNVCAPDRVGGTTSGLPRRPCGPTGRRRWLLSRRAGLPGGLGAGQRPTSALRPRRGRQSDDTRPRTEPGSSCHDPLAALSVLHERQIRRAHICRFPSGQPVRPPVRRPAGGFGHRACSDRCRTPSSPARVPGSRKVNCQWLTSSTVS